MGVEAGVFENWIAAAPVVAIGAPLGAFVVQFIGRRPTLVFVAVLCVAQFAWTCHVEREAMGVMRLVISLVAVLLCFAGFEKLRTWGGVLVGEARARKQTGPERPAPDLET